MVAADVQELIQRAVELRYVILWVVWFGGTTVVTIRVLTTHHNYARHFPFLQRNTALWQRQADPGLEQLRREMWRRARVAVLWELGSPLLVVATIKLLAVTGILHTFSCATVP